MGLPGRDIAFIVEKLNEHLQLKMTVVEFDEKSNQPEELEQLFIAVLSALQKDIATVVSDSPDIKIHRLKDFIIRVLGFRHLRETDQNALSQGLLSGNPTVILPIMLNILQGFSKLEVRVYLAKYLTRIRVPEEFLVQFGDVREANDQYSQMLQAFKTAHQAYMATKHAFFSPDNIQKQFAGKEREKESLKSRVEDHQKKVQSMHPEASKIVTLTSALRYGNDQELKLQESRKNQLSQLEDSDATLRDVRSRLAETETDIADLSADEILNKIENEVKRYRESCYETIPAQMEQTQQQINQMQELTSGGDVTRLIRDVEQDNILLKQSINELTNRLSKSKSAPRGIDKRAEVFRRQASIITNKKNELEAKLETTRRDHQSLLQKRAEMEEQLKRYDGVEIPTEEEFRQFKTKLFEKANICKKMKAELAEFRSEIAVLRTTYEILKSRHASIEELLDKLEVEKGVTGFRQIKNELEQVSMKKGEIDEKKGRTLQEISVMVKSINEEINEKKQLLLPKKTEMKQVQMAYQEIEHEYLSKKSAYDSLKVNADSELSELRQEIDVLGQDLSTSESLYHRLNAQIEVLEVAERRVNDEIQYRQNTGSRFSEEHRTYQELLQTRLQTLELGSKDLREKKKILQEDHDNNLRQIQMFHGAKRLLEEKMYALRSRAGANTELSHTSYGAYRLVIGEM